jgi:hypothetical protein
MTQWEWVAGPCLLLWQFYPRCQSVRRPFDDASLVALQHGSNSTRVANLLQCHAHEGHRPRCILTSSHWPLKGHIRTAGTHINTIYMLHAVSECQHSVIALSL